MDAVFSIKTSVYADDESDSIEMVTEGDYSYGGGVIHLAYDESELTGMQGTRTSFEVEGSCVNMTRVGTVNSHVMFHTGERHLFAYGTPEGVMTMGVETHSVVNRLGAAGGNLELHYTIDVMGTQISRNEVLINVDGL